MLGSGRPLEGRFIGYTLDLDGLLGHLGRIYVPHTKGLRTLVLLEAHRAPYSTHPSVNKMHLNLRQLYFWPGMKCDIVDFVTRFLEF